MNFDLRQMELDIFEAVDKHGRIGYFDGADSEATEYLSEKYPSEEEQQQVTVLIKYLLEKRYLFPFFSGKTGKELGPYVRGLTPKGFDRMRRLQARKRTWIKDNWLALGVAATTTITGIGSVAANLILDWD